MNLAEALDGVDELGHGDLLTQTGDFRFKITTKPPS
jgi:hypothetical protein